MIEVKADYTNSIVNIIATISEHFGVSHTYSSLPLKLQKRVLLVAIDGLGYNWLKTHRPHSFLAKHIVQKVTSTTPSTTAVAMSTFMHGYPAQQTGLTGWNMFSPEFQTQITALRFTERDTKESLLEKGFCYTDLFPDHKVTTQLSVLTSEVYPVEIKPMIEPTDTHAFMQYDTESFDDFGQKILDAYARNSEYIMAYWPYYDSQMHKTGDVGEESLQHFDKLDATLENIFAQMSEISIIVSADHGHITVSKWIDLSQHPKIESLLSQPLVGEPRFGYAYVEPEKRNEFVSELKKIAGDTLQIIPSKDFLDSNRFGHFDPHPRLVDRIGDFILIPIEGYGITDSRAREHMQEKISHHGGVSADEMYVPLIVVQK